MKKRKKTFIILGIIILLMVVFSMFRGHESVLPPVKTAKAELRNIIETVEANGKIKPEVDVAIGSDVSGEIIALPFKEGDQVKIGDTLARINPDLYEAALNRTDASLNNSLANEANSRARYTQSEAQFNLQQKNFDRQKQLFKEGVISQADYDNAESQYLVAKAELEAASQTVKAAEFTVQSSLASQKEAHDNLNRTIILSPMEGTISELDKEVGEHVLGSAGVSMTELMKVANLDNMEVSVDVNENDIVKVSIGDTANVEVDAYLNRNFLGIVTEIANSASTEGVSADQVTNFTVKIRILHNSYQDLLPPDKPHYSPFRPGMSATVEIKTNRVENVVSVPVESVTTRTDTTTVKPGSRRHVVNHGNEEVEPMECVFVYKNGKAILHVIKTGLQDAKWFEVREGISEGDEIITYPYDAVSKLLRNGDEVEKSNRVSGKVGEEGSAISIEIG